MSDPRSAASTVVALALLSTALAAHETADQPGGAAKLHLKELQELGSVLVDQAGMSLYLFEADTRGGEGSAPESTCRDVCARAWPPLVTDGEPEAHDDLYPEFVGTIERHDGTTQVTYDGWPLYYFSADMTPGHARGHDVELNGGEWYLVTPKGEKAGEEH